MAPAFPSLCKRVALVHIARAESPLKPLHSLRRTAMRESLWVDMAGRHSLQAIVAHCCRGVEAFFHFAGIEQFSLIG